jgi:DhnA family fructose-bisphosphate aldolase class Ia
LILQSTFYVPELPWKDYQISFIEEATALGADAIAMSIGVIGDYQGEEVAMLSRLVKEASPFGMPVIGHIYPKGNTTKPEDFYSVRYLQYAAHLGAEIGLDIVKVPYTGSPDTFKKVVASCPIKLVVAGGPNTSTLFEKLEMAHGAIEAGADGITFGRNVWQDNNIVAIITALKAIVYRGASVKKAVEIYQETASKK